MKKLAFANVLLGIVIIALSCVLAFKMGLFEKIALNFREDPDKVVAKDKTIEQSGKLYSYGCKVFKKGEEQVTKGIHINVKDAYITKETKGLTITSNIFNTDESGHIIDDDKLMVVDAEVWCDRPDEGMDYFKVAMNDNNRIYDCSEIVGSSWYEDLSPAQINDPLLYINGKYLPQQPTEMNIIFLLKETDEQKLKKNDFYFEINTSGIQPGDLENPEKQCSFLKIGKVREQ